MRAALALAALALAACTPPDAARVADEHWADCNDAGSPSQRASACGAVATNASEPIERRVGALINRGIVRANDADYARAVADFGRALRLDPNNARAFYERGVIHQERGAYDSAVVDFDAALRLDPNLRGAAARREEAVQGREGAYWADLAALDRALTETPNSAELLNNRCWLRATNNQELQQALADCNDAVRLAPRSGAALDSRGLVHLKMENFAAALADYDAALVLEPTRGHYRYGRGVALIRLGREAEGRAELVRALEAEPNVERLYRSYGVDV